MIPYVLPLIALLLLMIWLCSRFKHKVSRVVMATITSTLAMLEISAWYLTGQWLDDKAIKHLNWSDINDFAFQFSTELWLFVSCWVGLILIISFLATLLRNNKPKGLIQAPLVGVCLVILLYPPGMIQPLWQSYRINQASSQSLNEGLNKLGIEATAMTKPNQVKATAGKNIIVISLESIEQGFLQPPYAELTPNLSALSQAWTFFNQMPPLSGSDWTSGSLYTQQTGLPALFNQAHFNNNNLFQNSNRFQLTSLNHVLQTAGYQTKYLIGKPEFAGMDSMLNTLGIEIVSERNALGKYPNAKPGLHDKDLFNEAKLQIEAMRQSKQPFALFMSTINTHFPEGIMDKRMQGLVPERSLQLEFLIAATDYLLGDFINHLEKENLLSNTVVYIFPDHTLMGNSGTIINNLEKNGRQLYLLSSAKTDAFKISTTMPIYQTDLPRLILDGAEVQSNAKFLSDFIPPGKTPAFIEQHTLNIAAVNNAALERKDFSTGFTVELQNRQLIITGDDHSLTMPVRFFKPTEIYQVVFNNSWVPLEQGLISLNEAFVNDHIEPRQEQRFLQIHIERGAIKKITLTDRMGTELIKSSEPLITHEVELTELNRQADLRLAAWQAQQMANKVPLKQYAEDSNRFIAHAGGAIDGKKYTNSLEALNHNYQLGFRLFELDIQQTADGQYVAVHDWPQWQQQTLFEGELPPSHDTFLQQKIWQQYSPLDMAGINAWFKQHPDATLVTDKVNDPKSFAAGFADNSRLMMELFSWSAVQAAKDLSLKAVIPTGDLLFNMPGNPIKFLQNKGIQHVAASRRWVDSSPGMLRQLNQAGIKIFAFHIGFDPGKDETHVICHERQHFFGLYADHWDFKVPRNCQN